MDADVVSAIGTLLTAVAALIVSIEARANDRAKVRVNFSDRVIGIFSSRPPGESAIETLNTSFLIFNSGKRPSAIEEIKCYITAGEHRDELLNVSKIIHKTIRLPVPIGNDSAQEIEIVWALGRAGVWAQYGGRYSLLPSSTSYELQVKVLSGKVLSKRYGGSDTEVLPVEVAEEYNALDVHTQAPERERSE
jgi:hypothetical protein